MAIPVGLVDCNNFYASCVLSNNDGCVIARSNEAKALGITMGDPWHLMKDKHRGAGIIVRSSNYTLYGDMSARVMRVRRTSRPTSKSIPSTKLSLASAVSRRGSKRTAASCAARCCNGPAFRSRSAWRRPRRFKVANRFAKKDPATGGVCLLLDEAAQRDALGRMALIDLWGIGSRLARRLEGLGIDTPLKLLDADPHFMRGHFSVVMERTIRELRGLPCIDLEEGTPERKSIISSRSFGRAIETEGEMREAVAVYTARAAEKARRQNLAVVALAVFVETNEFKPNDPQYSTSRTLRPPVATADTGKLIHAGMLALSAIWRPGFHYKKAGTVLLEFVLSSKVQPGLFDRPDDGTYTGSSRYEARWLSLTFRTLGSDSSKGDIAACRKWLDQILKWLQDGEAWADPALILGRDTLRYCRSPVVEPQ